MLNEDREHNLRVWLGELKDELITLEQNRKTYKEAINLFDLRIDFLYASAEHMDYLAKKSIYEQFVEPIKGKRDDSRKMLDDFEEENFERIKALKELIARLEKETVDSKRDSIVE
ncbi:hypothetical protein [Paenibacillus sp. LPE1-1-1.1]|uniref:hypothetical protein n=1 Tax=Paenibacillus sp. LPE1-1-1.1 TaxID=3135230 RepID=UPI0034235933